MVIRANIKEALRSLVSAKQRTILALIGIVIGIGSVIGMVSVGTIVENESVRQFKDMGIDIIVVTKESDGITASTGFVLKDVMDLKQGNKDVLEVAPFASAGARVGRSGKEVFVDLYGVTASFFDLNKLTIRRGRAITDLDQDRYFVVVGEDVEQIMKKEGHTDVVGKQFPFGGRVYTVVGVLNTVPEGGGIRPAGLNRSVITHVSTGVRAFENGMINKFLARVGGKDSAVVKSAIETYFGKKGKGSKVSIKTAEELIAQMEKQMQLYTLLLGAIGSISLLVGGVGVMNVMLISVTERRKEIGIRRALGAHQSDIMSQFIIESVVLCFVGGIVGIILGTGVSYIFARVSNYEFLVSQTAIFLGFGVSMGVGIFFGYYPARQAARSDPIAALRS
jgi:putative ABC transport system permease protein